MTYCICEFNHPPYWSSSSCGRSKWFNVTNGSIPVQKCTKRILFSNSLLVIEEVFILKIEVQRKNYLFVKENQWGCYKIEFLLDSPPQIYLLKSQIPFKWKLHLICFSLWKWCICTHLVKFLTMIWKTCRNWLQGS